MKAKYLVVGGGITAASILLFLYASAQPVTPNCILDNCGLENGGKLYLTSILPIMMFTLGGWMLALGIRRK